MAVNRLLPKKTVTNAFIMDYELLVKDFDIDIEQIIYEEKDREKEFEQGDTPAPTPPPDENIDLPF